MPIRLTPAVKAIAIACFAAFLIQQTGDQFFGTGLLGWLALVPSGFINEFRFWQIFTYAFLHGDVLHLFLNLMMLVFMGGELEGAWGTRRFLRYYFFCSLSAGFFYLLLQLLVLKGGNLHAPMVGASGAIYGLLMAYGLIFGERTLLFMMLFPMKAKHFIWILALIELMSTVFSAHGGLASAAHLGGMVAGFGYLWGRASWAIAKKRRAEAPKKAKRRQINPKHLKLVINNRNRVQLETDDDGDDSSPTYH